MTSWLEDPAVAGIDRKKLDFLQMLVFETNNLTKEQMLPFLMVVAKRSKENQISFTEEEMNTIISTLQKYSTPDEIDKMNKMMSLYRNRMK